MVFRGIMGRRFWFSFIILAVLILIVFFMRQRNLLPYKSNRNTQQLASATPHSTPTPTLYPYENLTIPYLRKQTYDSNLGSLQQISENSTYVTYLTSYLSDGLKINGLLTVPTGIAPNGGWPAIVFVHGYIPPKQYNTLTFYVDYVDYLASNGYVVFKIDLRGNGTSDGTPQGAYFSNGYVIDTLNAYAALQNAHVASPSASTNSIPAAGSSAKTNNITPSGPASLTAAIVNVNPLKIGLWGHSMAGNIVMRAWAVKPTIPAVVIWSGAGYSYTDLEKYKIHDPSYQPIHSASTSAGLQNSIQKLYGKPDLNNFFWHDLAPVSFLPDLKGAIQIDQAKDDTVVNVGYNQDLIKLFDATTVPHTFIEYPTGGHNITEPSFTQAMENTVNFYNKYLK